MAKETFRNKRVFQKYTDAQVKEVLAQLESGKSFRQVSKDHNIPLGTLHRMKNNSGGRKVGPPTALTQDEEGLLVTAILTAQKANQPMIREDIKCMVMEFMSAIQRKSQFKDGKPGKKWMRSFLLRHPEISLRSPEILEVNRSKQLSKEVLDRFFGEVLLPVMTKDNLLDDPKRLWNIDESGFTGNPKAGKVLAKKGSKTISQLTPNSAKRMTSVLFCASAAGEYLPPLIVYKGKYLQSTHCQGGPPGTLYSTTESGWMETSVFETWITDIFVKHTNHLERPLLLIYDGHNSHLTYNTVKTCMDNNIRLICLPPHTSHALQPLDVGVFGPLKKAWRHAVRRFYAESRQTAITNQTFPTVLNQTWSKIKPEWAVEGFSGAGIFPVDKSKALAKSADAAMEESDVNEGVMSPRKLERKQLAKSILDAIAPAASDQTKAALENLTKKRKRVQAKIGEVLTTEEVAARLQSEAADRAAGKKGAGRKKKKTNEPTATATATAAVSTAATKASTTEEPTAVEVLTQEPTAVEESTSAERPVLKAKPTARKKEVVVRQQLGKPKKRPAKASSKGLPGKASKYKPLGAEAPGNPSTSAGATSMDVGATQIDGGATSMDAGALSMDAGALLKDAGARVADATVTDAGATVTDAGATVTDAGATSTDTGATSTDADATTTDIRNEAQQLGSTGGADKDISKGNRTAKKKLIFSETSDEIGQMGEILSKKRSMVTCLIVFV